MLIADELTPSLAAQVDWTKVRGFATDAGSRTYHTAILARSLDVPAVVGLHDASRSIQAGQLVVIDGTAQRDHRRSRRGDARARRAQRRRSPAGAGRRRRAAPAGGDRRRRPHPARSEHRVPRRPGRGALRGRRRHRAVPLGVPADRRRARHPDEERAVRDLPRHARRHGAGAGHGPDVRRRRGSADAAVRRSRRSARRLGWPTKSAAAGRGCAGCA